MRILRKLDEIELKLQKLRGKRSITHKHIPTSLALVGHYSNVLMKENEYFIYRGEDCADVFTKKIRKILYNLENFPKNYFYRKRSDKILVIENLSYT